MHMKRNKSVYLIIKEDLKTKIANQEYKTNEMIPTELELASFYNVSRTTIRKATDLLVFEGLLVRKPGSGTFIKSNAIISKSTNHYGFTQEMLLQKKKVKTVVSKFTIEEVSAKVAEIIGISVGQMVYYFERIRYVEKDALQFERTYMSVQKYPDINISYLEKGKYSYVEKIKKQTVDFCIHTISPISCPKEISEIFKIDEKSPILKIDNITYLTDGSVMDYTIQFNNPSKYQMKYIRRKEKL